MVLRNVGFVSSIIIVWTKSVLSATCYTSDTAILGTGNIVVHNILSCASKASTQSTGSITTCMGQTYPAYAAVSLSCLECTTSVIDSTTGLQCLVNCMDDMTATDCITCTPTLSSSWTSACDKGQSSPSVDTSAESPTCTPDDIATLPSAAHFVTNSLNCLTDLGTFTSCLDANVPYYSSISARCKMCAEAQSTTDGISADGCGAICMQQPAGSDECNQCGVNIANQFNENCLGGQKSAWTISIATTFALLFAFLFV
jgi:hypothetical protein